MIKAEETSSPPQWMIELENRLHQVKQHHQLGHEVGAGSKCWKCVGCPGLELHFWRKICMKCKCKKEEHDVQTDQRDLSSQLVDVLLNKEKPKVPRPCGKVLQMKTIGSVPGTASLKPYTKSGTTSHTKSVPFTWVPPDVPDKVAAEYMEQLPERQLPINNSDGAKYRLIQLGRQIPAHDLTPDMCHDLPLDEKQRMLGYVNNIRTKAVGQGKLIRLCQTQYKEDSVPCSNLEPKYAAKLETNDAKTYQPEMDKNMNKNIDNLKNLFMSPYRSYGPGNEKPSPNTAFTNLPPHIPTSILKLPSQFQARRLTEASNNEDSLRRPDLNNYNGNDDDYSFLAGVADPNCTDNEELMSGILPLPPTPNEASNLVSIDQSQNTKKILDHPSASHLNVSGEKEPSGRPTESDVDKTCEEGVVVVVAKKMVCHQCKDELVFGGIAIVADRAGLSKAWHPQCFVCVTCKELLVDLVYFFHMGEVYCGRDYAAKLKVPRCSGCDELIFTKSYTNAENKNFHLRHFCCVECDKALGGLSYIFQEGSPFCLECYDEKYGNVCLTCRTVIKVNGQGIAYNGLHWHCTDSCFKCGFCNKSLVGSKFLISQDLPFCSPACKKNHLSVTNN